MNLVEWQGVGETLGDLTGKGNAQFIGAQVVGVEVAAVGGLSGVGRFEEAEPQLDGSVAHCRGYVGLGPVLPDPDGHLAVGPPQVTD
ncbi:MULTISPECIES: hypothetical protein [Rhodococcus]|uniref:Uncharacterized protein n=1 Tax=Rhodococcus jostii TaxID=132919 RepID=A0ABU4C6R0_RHOJO|nr:MULTISPECIES: hypothetical protein [Rhodococcus]MDI9951903.1 hypothetical protein [Rhodococcus sp. IEGM 1305]MDI9973630.1 hypothetical protein [Rhodococcus sp. IEGM 1307]MDV6279204.1 hypothetical protein [Rhodococcus jostii]